MDHDEYLKRRAELLKIRTDSFESFDKAVLSLATGSLALSITFLDKIGTPFNLLTYRLIFMTWSCLFCTILANLFSYLLAKWNMDRKIEELDDKYQKEIDGKQPDKPNVEKAFWQKRATNICNNIAFIAFFIGILVFTWYIFEIQRNNYTKTVTQQKKEESIMATPSNPLMEGKTETSAAIPSQTGTKTQTEIRGQTETTQAVSKPSKPATSTNSGKK